MRGTQVLFRVHFAFIHSVHGLFDRFSQREIEPGIVSNVLVEAAGQAQSPPQRDAQPVAPPRRRSLKETSFDAEVGLTLDMKAFNEKLRNKSETA